MAIMTIKVFLCLIIVSVSSISWGCATNEKTGNKSQTLSQPKPIQPTSAEILDAIARVYKNTVIVELDRNPSFIVGDFNADDSQDLAVVVKPTDGMLSEINSEFANWILEEPRKAILYDLNKRIQYFPRKPSPVKVEKGDILLTVIHGYGLTGWRNPDAKQTYLLKNAVGIDMKSQPIKELDRVIRYKANLHQINSDVIKETLSGENGFLYWTGAKYAWYH